MEASPTLAVAKTQIIDLLIRRERVYGNEESIRHR